jgi:hypothetical protein
MCISEQFNRLEQQIAQEKVKVKVKFTLEQATKAQMVE